MRWVELSSVRLSSVRLYRWTALVYISGGVQSDAGGVDQATPGRVQHVRREVGGGGVDDEPGQVARGAHRFPSGPANPAGAAGPAKADALTGARSGRRPPPGPAWG